MKPSHFYSRLLPLFVVLSAIVLSCQKNYSPSSSPSQDPTKTLLMNATNDIVTTSNEESEDLGDVITSDDKDTGDSASDCRVVTFDTSKNVYPHQKTIDFGSGCTSNDGITRKGMKIITIYADPLTAPAGTLISNTTFKNFYVDGVNVTGDVKAYIDTPANPGPGVIKLVVDKKLSSSNGDLKTFTATDFWKQIAGASTPTREDDVLEITGTAAGNEILDGATVIEWTAKIDLLHPVIKRGDCNHRTQGALNIELHISTGGGSDFTEYLDYGDGTCDNKATLSINGGKPQEVTLPLFFWPLSL